MEEILAEAEKLARMILESERFQTLRRCEEKVLGDAAARDLTARYEQAALTIRRQEQEMQPISAQQKAELRSLREQIEARPELRDLAQAQADYAAMMDGVNQTIHGVLAAGFEGTEPGEEDGEGGGDSGQGGDSGPSRLILP